MRIKITLFVFLIACVSPVFAQRYAEDYVINRGAKPNRHVEMIYGVAAGTAFPKMSDKQDLIDINNKAGYEFGMMWGVKLGGLEVVPEIWYSHANTDLRIKSTDETYYLVSHDIEMPIIFAIPVSFLRFNVGPTFSLMNQSHIEVAGESIDFGRTKSTAGYLIGVSALIREHFIVDFRFTGRFVSNSQEWFEEQTHYDYRYYSFGLHAGYRF